MSEVTESSVQDIPIVPGEPLAKDPRGIWCYLYGLDQFGKLFNARQLLALATFARLVGEATKDMLDRRLDDRYATAVSTYLAFGLNRFANTNSTLTRLMSAGGRGIVGTFARQALPMVWDYAEANPFGVSASWPSAIQAIRDSLTVCLYSPSVWPVGHAYQHHAQTTFDGPPVTVIVTDPPYYDSINYSDLSDYFYVWLKRSIGFLYPELLGLPLTPKREQVVMNVYATSKSGSLVGRKGQARQEYVDGMSESFRAIASSVLNDGIVGVVFAHTDPDAWATLIEGLLSAGLVPDASWPIDTELQNKVSNLGQARLKTSVWMACRKRDTVADDTFLGDLIKEMSPVIRERLLYFWSKGIRGADFFISAIGPALSVYGRYSRVLRPDGTDVTVRDFLDIVRRESTTVALEQVLGDADLGAIDPVTRQYLTWMWSYSRSPLDAGGAIALCLATGATYDDTTREHSIAAERRERNKKVVRIRTIRQRATEDEDLGIGTAARPASLIDQLQYAAWLWSQNHADRLGAYRSDLGETCWSALRTLGQAVAECLPDGDEDRRIILGLLGSSVSATAPTDSHVTQTAGAMLPGFEVEEQ